MRGLKYRQRKDVKIHVNIRKPVVVCEHRYIPA